LRTKLQSHSEGWIAAADNLPYHFVVMESVPLLEMIPVQRAAAVRATFALMLFSAFACSGPVYAQNAKSGAIVESPARAEVEKLIRDSHAEVAVVFRTLDGKQELMIAPDMAFHAASTMKIPVMIELFAQAHDGKLRLDDPLLVKNEFHSIVDGSAYQLNAADDSDADIYKSVGGTLTLRQLCEAMITRSSNLAANLLIERLGVASVQTTIARLRADGMVLLRGVEDSKAFQAGKNNTTTARALQILLQAIAENKAGDAESCRQMMEILKRQTMNEAIPAGLPAGTIVAHKTGEITGIHHDAAIVLSARPFVLVILVQGIEDRDTSSALMSAITKAIYAGVETSAR
jgi:beta-lactamase class A